jgi:hypothetical protein
MMKFPHSKRKIELMFCPARLGENVGELTFQGNDMGQLARYTLPLYLSNFLQFVIIPWNILMRTQCYVAENFRPLALKGAISEKDMGFWTGQEP